MNFYEQIGRIRIRLEPDELKAAGIDEGDWVPLTLGGRLTLRAWLNLTLDPFGLTYVADGDGLRVVRRTPDNGGLSRPSPRQEAGQCPRRRGTEGEGHVRLPGRVVEAGRGGPGSEDRRELRARPLARRSGAIKPETTATGSAVDEPLSSALTRLLAPLGMTYVVRDEAVVLTTALDRASGRIACSSVRRSPASCRKPDPTPPVQLTAPAWTAAGRCPWARARAGTARRSSPIPRGRSIWRLYRRSSSGACRCRRSRD